MRWSLLVCVLLASSLLVEGCSSSSSSASFNVPAITPIVDAALPAGLKASHLAGKSKFTKNTQVHSIANVLRDHSFTPDNQPASETATAITFIQNLFTNYYTGNDGSLVQGYVNSLVEQVDSRMSGIKTQISTLGNKPACLSATQQTTAPEVELGVIDPMFNFSAPYLQCNNSFSSGGQSGPGAGAAFGQDSTGTNFSLWLYLNWSASNSPSPTATTFDQLGGFLGVANVLNVGSTSSASPETVDGMLVSYAPYGTCQSCQNTITMTRFTASPTTNTFALFVSSSYMNQQGFDAAGTGNGAPSNLGTGFRLVSDGTHVYSDGILYDPAQGSNGTFYYYDVCLNAANLSLDGTPTDCTTLANDYTTTTFATLYPGVTNPNPLATSPTLNFNEITGCSATLPTHGSNTLAASAGASNNSCPGSIAPAGSPMSETLATDITSPQSAILSALSAVGLPSGLPQL